MSVARVVGKTAKSTLLASVAAQLHSPSQPIQQHEIDTVSREIFNRQRGPVGMSDGSDEDDQHWISIDRATLKSTIIQLGENLSLRPEIQQALAQEVEAMALQEPDAVADSPQIVSSSSVSVEVVEEIEQPIQGAVVPEPALHSEPAAEPAAPKVDPSLLDRLVAWIRGLLWIPEPQSEKPGEVAVSETPLESTQSSKLATWAQRALAVASVLIMMVMMRRGAPALYRTLTRLFV